MKHINRWQVAIKQVSCGLLAATLLAGCGAGVFGQQESSSAVPGSQLPAESAAPTESLEQPEAQQGLPMPAEGVSALTGLQGDYHQRPVAVMIQNSKAAWPQWGISSADIIVEAVTEGQDTRMMALYPNVQAVEKVGPVGPARDVFLQFAMPFSAIPMFIGSDIYASNLLNLYRYQPLDGLYAGTTAFDLDGERDKTYPQEYSWYAHKALIPGALEQYGQSSSGDTPSFFAFAQNSVPEGSGGTRLEIRYGESRTAVLEYSADAGSYLLKENDQPQWDATLENGECRFTNVIVLMASSGWKDDGVTREYDLTSGKGLYLCGGGAKIIQWQKGSPAAGLMLFDQAGNAIAVQPGRSYIGVWGGIEGQALRLTDAAGAEQPLPQIPEPLPVNEPQQEQPAQESQQPQQEALPVEPAEPAQ